MMRRVQSDEDDSTARRALQEAGDEAYGSGDGEGHEWEAGSVNAPIWVPTTNTFALPHFAEHAEWLRRRRADALNDIVRMRALQENGEWQRRRDAEIAAGVKAGRDRDSNQRIRRGLERQVDHVTRLRMLITGTMPTEQELQMIDDTIHPAPLTAAQAEALRAQAQSELTNQSLTAQGIRITPAGLTDTAGAAKYLGVGIRTLERWRKQGTGPVSTPLHGRCWYAIADLDAYVESSRAAG